MRPLLLSLLAAAIVSGCNCGGEPCDPNTDVSRCEANVLVSCPQPGVDQIFGANQWRRHSCDTGESCVEAAGAAFCALSDQPEAACDGGSEKVCESGTSQLACESGYAIYRFPCRTCSPTDAGVSCEGGPSTKCTADAECASGLRCSNGYCASAGT